MANLVEDVSQWTASANDVIQLGLISPASAFANEERDIEVFSTFHPTFTYPIFGENETIYGYKDLEIKLYFKADDLTPLLDIKYGAKLQETENGSSFKLENTSYKPSVTTETEDENEKNRRDAVEGSQADDIQGLLMDKLPANISTNTKSFMEKLKFKDKESFIPPGRHISQYIKSGKSYEVFCASLSVLRCKELFANIQILVLFLVEGGSLIDMDDEEWSTNRWDVYFLYEKSDVRGYSLVGYCTVFNYYWFSLDDSSNCRSRISQFMILPPFQNSGHGSKLYSTIIFDLLGLERAREITVEDPSERFEEMRDRSDLRRLLANNTFNNSTIEVLQLEACSYDDYIEKTRIFNKIPKRQFARLLEMHLLSLLEQSKHSSGNPKAKFVTHVKRRLYRHNKDVLQQLDPIERIEKLEETYTSVVQDYLNLIDGISNSVIGSSEKVRKRALSNRSTKDFTIELNEEDRKHEEKGDDNTQMSDSPIQHKRKKAKN